MLLKSVEKCQVMPLVYDGHKPFEMLQTKQSAYIINVKFYRSFNYVKRLND